MNKSRTKVEHSFEQFNQSPKQNRITTLFMTFDSCEQMKNYWIGEEKEARMDLQQIWLPYFGSNNGTKGWYTTHSYSGNSAQVQWNSFAVPFQSISVITIQHSNWKSKQKQKKNWIGKLVSLHRVRSVVFNKTTHTNNKKNNWFYKSIEFDR